MKPLKFLVIVAALAPLSSAQTSNNTTFKKALSAIVAPAASGPLPNIGQGGHLLTVMLPTATADVTGLQVRIEASYNNTLFFPISEDVKTAKYNGSFAYGVVRANGNFPYIRVRAVAVSSTLAMDAWYTGSLYPIANVSFDADRYIVTPPGSATATSETYIYHVAPPIPSQWTSVNFDAGLTSRVDHANGVMSLREDGNNNGQFRYVCKPIAAAPIKYRAMLSAPDQYWTNDAGWTIGIALRNSTTRKSIAFMLATGYFVSVAKFQFDQTGANSGNYYGSGGGTITPNWPITFEVFDDGTKRTYSFWNGYSNTGTWLSTNWVMHLFSADYEDSFIVPDQFCVVFTRTNGNYVTNVEVMGYEEVKP